MLLPVAGIPLAVLAARRAANTGIEVIVATSTDHSDDVLADTLTAAGLRVVRGDLQDTRARFVAAVEAYADHDILVRLTADNVVPDGALIDELVADFVARGLDYLVCMAGTSGLPYGLGGEVLRVGALREAAATADAQPDREHVTPAVARRFGRSYFTKYAGLRLDAHRSTVDQLEDYTRIAELFAGVDDPVGVSAIELARRLPALRCAPVVTVPATDLVVGTAQLGMPYGIANRSGRPDAAIARDILRTAISNGAVCIDTARSYGDSEAVVGGALTGGWQSRAVVVTKLAALQDVAADAPAGEVGLHVETSVLESCRALRRRRLDVVLLHRAAHRTAWDGAAWERLTELAARGVIGKLGVSVQNPDELQEVLGDPRVEQVQLPFNLLDWRWDDGIARLEEVRSRRGLTVHVRSALLQGLIPNGDPRLWERAGVGDPDDVIRALAGLPEQCGRADLVDLAISYVRAQPWCDGVVVGVETVEQLERNLRVFDAGPLDRAGVEQVLALRPRVPRPVLDPSTWRAAA